MQEVTRVTKALERAILENRTERFAVPDRNDAVVLSPKERHCRQGLDLASTIEEMSRLTTPADDVSHGSCECSRRASGAVHASSPPALVGRERAPVQVHHETGRSSHPGLTTALDHERKRSKTKHERHILPETTRGHEREPTDRLRTV
jgi:hypothetical protein